jgi:hypothetical protein
VHTFKSQSGVVVVRGGIEEQKPSFYTFFLQRGPLSNSGGRSSTTPVCPFKTYRVARQSYSAFIGWLFIFMDRRVYSSCFPKYKKKPPTGSYATNPLKIQTADRQTDSPIPTNFHIPLDLERTKIHTYMQVVAFQTSSESRAPNSRHQKGFPSSKREGIKNKKMYIALVI